jgi:hypothetical protein
METLLGFFSTDVSTGVISVLNRVLIDNDVLVLVQCNL